MQQQINGRAMHLTTPMPSFQNEHARWIRCSEPQMDYNLIWMRNGANDPCIPSVAFYYGILRERYSNMDQRMESDSSPCSRHLAIPCQVTCKQVQILRPYLGEWWWGMPWIHFGGQACGLCLPWILNIDLSGSNFSVDQKHRSINVLCLNAWSTI